MAPRPPLKPTKPVSRSGSGLFALVIAAIVVIGLALPASLPLLVVGLIPSATAFVTEHDPRRMLVRTMLPLNLAGIMIYVASLWHGDRSFVTSIQMLRTPTTWLVMFASAGIGSLLHFAMPAVVTLFLRDRLNRRRDAQEKLIAEMKTEWGPEVSPESPEDAAAA